MLPQLRRLAARYGDALAIVGVHAGKYPNERRIPQLRAALDRLGVHHPVLNDRTFRAWRAFGIFGWPTLVLLDPAGRVVHTKVGESTAEYWISLLDRLPDGPTPRSAALPEALHDTTQLQRAVHYPEGIAAASDRVALADTANHRVLIGRLRGGELVVNQIIGSGLPGAEDGPAPTARFCQPRGLAFDGATLYVADTGNHRVRAVDLASGAVRTVLGTGVRAPVGTTGGAGTATPIASPWGIAAADGHLLIAMAGLHQLWRYDPGTRQATVLAGTGQEDLEDGTLPAAAFAQPSGVAALADQLYVVDAEAQAIRSVDIAANAVTTLVGTGLFDFADKDGVGLAALLQHPQAIAAHGGALYIADTYNHKIKLLDPATGECRSWLGRRRIAGYADGPATEAAFDEPGALAVADGQLLIADTNNHALRAADLQTGEVRTIAIGGLVQPEPQEER